MQETEQPETTTNSAPLEDATLQMVEMDFDRLVTQVKSYLNVMSVRQVKRTVINAMLFKVKPESSIKFHSKMEAICTGVLARLIDTRMIIINHQLMKELGDTNQTNEGEENNVQQP